MKKRNRKLLFTSTLLLAASMSLSSGVFAATSVNGSLSGYSTHGGLSMGGNSATASTTFGTTSGLTASVTYTYKWGAISDSYTVTNYQSAGSTNVSATASANHVNPLSVSATGSHSVSYNGGYWSNSTST